MRSERVAQPDEAAWEAFTYHGGARDVARRLRPDIAEWLDLSTGVNPHAWPTPALAAETWTRLPEADGLRALRAAAARRYGAPAEAAVVAADGSERLIRMLALILPAARVGVLGLTYSGHARAWRAAGAEVEAVERLEGLPGCDVAVVVNPNNPDGRVVPAVALLALGEKLAARGGTLIVDEAYADFDGAAESLAPRLPAAGAVVLRSFGKTYGLAGLRLGFALAAADLASRLSEALGPWPVSGPALAIGAAALADDAWLAATAARLGREAARLDALLVGTGWRIVGGTRLFRLATRPDARAAFFRLLEAGILVRPFAEAPSRLRFGLPGDEAGWRRLAAALAG